MFKPMNYLSVCSGIEAATVAWHPLGWNPVGFGEIEKFPSQVLAHHYPEVPNFGDMTKFKEWQIESDVNVLVGGTPCQSFSVAGLRKGLDDPRGNLMLTYLAIAAKFRPKWLVWENVPGVLSSNGGHDFASLLRGMGELGYGFAYRVLDAQYFGVAQRRRRVFVVGYLGNWQRAAAVLFERHSLCGYPAPSREKGKSAAPSVTTGAPFSRTGNDRVEAEAMVTTVRMVAFGKYSDDGSASAMKARDYKDATDLVMQPIALAENIIGRKPENGGNGDGFTDGGPMYTLNATGVHGVAQPISFDLVQITSKINRTKVEEGLPVSILAKGTQMHVAQAVNIYGGNKRTDRPEGGFYVRMGEETSKTLDAASGLNPTCSQGDTAVMQPVAFDAYNQTTSDTVAALRCAAGGVFDNTVAQPIPLNSMNCLRSPDADASTGCGIGDEGEAMYTLTKQHHHAVAQAMAVRRLTPTECERLQGFPDGYTDIRHGGKSTPDGPRYKALGNSMAVPVMAWIGKRIQEVEAING